MSEKSEYLKFKNACIKAGKEVIPFWEWKFIKEKLEEAQKLGLTEEG